MDCYAAIDVHYRNESATTALVEFSDFLSCVISRTLIQESETVAPYILKLTDQLSKNRMIDKALYLNKLNYLI